LIVAKVYFCALTQALTSSFFQIAVDIVITLIGIVLGLFAALLLPRCRGTQKGRS
jgi:hypothetical protein